MDETGVSGELTEPSSGAQGHTSTGGTIAKQDVPQGKQEERPVDTEFVEVKLSQEPSSQKTRETKDGMEQKNPFIFQLDESVCDKVSPSDQVWTVSRERGVRLRMSAGGAGSTTPVSVPSLFKDTVSKIPQALALAVKRGGNWTRWTYADYYRDCIKAAKSFIKLGLEQYHGVGIIGFNAPEWLISEIGSIYAGGLAVGVYTTNTAEASEYILSHSQCNIIVVENDVQLQKILRIRRNLPHLKAIVQYTGNLKEKYEDVYTWQEFIELGKDVPDGAVQARLNGVCVNKCACLVYTSGTTGNPKGVMLSHDNVTWTARLVVHDFKFEFGKEVCISYLPLSHVAAQMTDVFGAISAGVSIFFAQPDALKGSLGQTLKEVRPTAFLGVPRVWEKMEESIKQIGKTTTGIKKSIATWAKDVGLESRRREMNGQNKPFAYKIANKLLFKKVRLNLGLDRCRIQMTGAAPIMTETLEYFMSLDIQINSIYGMSESTGPHTYELPNRYLVGSVGVELTGAETKLDNKDEDGNGEICMGGRHVFMGYLNNEEKTKEAIDHDGWLHTGDVGKKNKKGFLAITGRIKELLITAGGENVAPVPLEDNVKEALPCVSNCMLIGDKRKFLSLLITLKTVVNPDTMMPEDKLSPPALDWCKVVGSGATSVSQIIDHKDANVLKAIQGGIEKANVKAPSRAQKIQKWSILPTDFSIPGGELGPTLKLKRPVVMEKYERTIEAFYFNT